jgi:hypothetical protein
MHNPIRSFAREELSKRAGMSNVQALECESGVFQLK